MSESAQLLLLSHPEDGRDVGLAVVRSLVPGNQDLSRSNVGRHHSHPPWAVGPISGISRPFSGVSGSAYWTQVGDFHHLARSGGAHHFTLLPRAAIPGTSLSPRRQGAVFGRVLRTP